MQQVKYRDPKESKAQIRAFAYKVLRRIHALGGKTTSLEDVEQELWIAWCKACEAYDEKGGASFKTFLHIGMVRHINRYVQNNFERLHGETVALSLEAPMGDDDGATLAEAVPDTAERQDTKLIEEDVRERVMRRLTPRARQFVQILHDQPIELVRELDKFKEKQKVAREVGVQFSAPRRLTSWMVFDLMGASRTERTAIMREIEAVTRKFA